MSQHIILFDWDGTLIHSLDMKIANAGRLFAQAFDVLPDEVEAAYRLHTGIPRRYLFDAICKEVGLPPLEDAEFAELSPSFSQMNLDSLTGEGAPSLLREGTEATLQQLQQAGHFLYVSSSADAHEIIEVAKAAGIDRYFVEILGSHPAFGKGEEHVAYATQKHNLSRQETLFVGDDLADIRLGREAGVRVFAITGTHTQEQLSAEGPEGVLQNLQELIKVESLGISVV